LGEDDAFGKGMPLSAVLVIEWGAKIWEPTRTSVKKAETVNSTGAETLFNSRERPRTGMDGWEDFRKD